MHSPLFFCPCVSCAVFHHESELCAATFQCSSVTFSPNIVDFSLIKLYNKWHCMSERHGIFFFNANSTLYFPFQISHGTVCCTSYLELCLLRSTMVPTPFIQQSYVLLWQARGCGCSTLSIVAWKHVESSIIMTDSDKMDTSV